MDHRGQVGIDIVTNGGDVGGIALQSSQRGLGVVLAHEGNPTGQTLVQHETERIQIGAQVEFVTFHLLG